MPAHRDHTLANAPLEDLLSILLRQFKRPLATQGITLTDADAAAITHEIVAGAPENDRRAAIRTALVALIAESEGVLARWGLTFEESLDAPMDEIPGWETTAEFLEVASEKANAELRISTGAALLMALGDARHAAKIVTLVERDANDPDAQIGRRLLSFAANLDPKAGDWIAQARSWAASQTR